MVWMAQTTTLLEMMKRILSLSLILAASGAMMAAKPNIVFVITDDQGYGDLACHGNEIIKTPNVDTLFAESSSLSDYHVAPTCSPSRCAIMSGNHAARAQAVPVGLFYRQQGCRPLLDAAVFFELGGES